MSGMLYRRVRPIIGYLILSTLFGRTLLLILAAVVVGMLGFGAYVYYAISAIGEPVLTNYSAITASDTVFVRCRDVGFSGSNKVAWVTMGGSPERPDNESDLVFDGGDILFEVERDTLVVYTRLKVPVPSGWNANAAVKQVEVDNPTFMNLLDRMREGRLGDCFRVPDRAA